jgi:hypothetical protein
MRYLQATTSPGAGGTKTWLLFYMIFVHGAIFFSDIARPDVFLHADRAPERMAAIRGLSSVGMSWKGLGTFLVTHGLAGDYLPQAILYLAGGRYAVILVQVSLMIAAVMAVYGMTHLFTASPKASLAAAVLYFHLPHSLVFPHVLASEGIFDPLLVISFYFAAVFFLEEQRSGLLLASAVLLGCATLVRPVTILWPLVICVTFLLNRFSLKQVLWYPTMCFAPLTLWMGFIWLNTGVFSMGSSSRDLGHNLYGQVAIIIERRLPEYERAQAKAAFLRERASSETSRDQLVMSPSDYFRFGLNYPRWYLSYLGEEAIIYVAKSGVEKITVDYLDLASDIREGLATMQYSWRDQVRSQGIITSVKLMLAEHPGLILTSLIGAVLVLLLWALAGIGSLCVLIDQAYTLRQRTFIAISAAFPLYLLAVSQAASGMESRHRAPAEFTLCLLAVLGWRVCRRISLHTTHWSRFGAAFSMAVSEGRDRV